MNDNCKQRKSVKMCVFAWIYNFIFFCHFLRISEVTYLSLSMFPGPVDQIDWEDFHTQTSLNAVDHDVKAFTVPDDEAGMIQFVRHLLEVEVGILREIFTKVSASYIIFNPVI